MVRNPVNLMLRLRTKLGEAKAIASCCYQTNGYHRKRQLPPLKALLQNEPYRPNRSLLSYILTYRKCNCE